MKEILNKAEGREGRKEVKEILKKAQGREGRKAAID